ncbi:MAG TPA: helix-turn-helix domain-containing protein [Thermomicrobiales bacterium]|nr:helix-turn-helix domain-containing protein [Thermomicrobiales bacterium]
MSGSIAPQFGEMMRTFRLGAGMSQELLSEASGVSVRTISDLERGQRSSAHLETIRLLASALALTTDERRRLIELAHPATGAAGSVPTSIGGNRWTASLPNPATPIVGRVHELERLTTLLGKRPRAIVTLTGPGGVGKTRLAIEAAHRMSPGFAAGAVFVDLAVVTDAARVPDAIASALGLTLQSGSAGDRLANVLSDRELLLLLDNFEQLVDASPFVAQLAAACPKLTILVTSRMRLRVSNEHELALPPLPLANIADSLDHLQTNEANLLFAERAKRVDPQFALSGQNAVAVTEICQRLDGLPLAIELAASRLRILPVPALLERLDRRLPLLSGGDRDRPTRQHSMRDTIAWSYELLDPTTKRFFRWMSVFAGGLSLESVEALGHALHLSPVDSLETVTTLVECGLARQIRPSSGSPRFLLFETIREFCLEQLTQTGELAAAHMVQATHFLEFAGREAPPPYEPVPVAWIGRLAAEHPNLLQAFDFLCVPETAQQSLQFAAAMGPYWHTRGPFSEWQPRLSRAFDLASPEPTILKTHVLFWMSLILGTTPDAPAALRAASRCIEMANQVGTTSDRAAAIQVMAWVQECHQQWGIARELREQAIDLWISVGNTYAHAICLVLNAGMAYALGELDRAQREGEQAEAMFQEMGNIDWGASAAWYQGLFAVAGGRLDLGATCYEKSLRSWLQSESASRWYRPLVGLADIAAAIGQFATAARLLGAADEMLLVSGRELIPFDRPGYARAESRCRDALGNAEFEAQASAGVRMTPDDWLAEARIILEAARLPAGEPYRQ